MKTYLVGGAVRDILLGLEPKDLDYVVVGSSPEEMLSLGYKQVGLSFPVFLHPESGDEYALARKERKVGPGYNGFEVDFDSSVTLEEDLSRRDLTINSIAWDPETNVFTDPFGGIDDLARRTIKHTSDAFSEDPLRVLRVARFTARYGFTVDDSTKELCKTVVASGEFDSITAERIWVEIEKLFETDQPSKGLDFLGDIGAFDTPKLRQYRNNVFAHACVDNKGLSTTEKMYFQLDLHVTKPDTIQKLKVPSAVYREIQFIYEMFIAVLFNPEQFVKLVDKFRPEMSSNGIQKFVLMSRKMKFDIDPSEEIMLQSAAAALLALDFTELVRGMTGPEIKEFVLRKKIDTVSKIYNATP
jgi:tRNA nucleotidyltransferase/poly(A) polymerase